jgi:FkbM family methyltransferase
MHGRSMTFSDKIRRALRALRGEEAYHLSEGLDALFFHADARERHLVFSAYHEQAKGNLLFAQSGHELYVVNSADRIISQDIYVHGSFCFHEVEEALKLISAHRCVDLGDMTFIDVGANIGVSCIPVVSRGLCKTAIAIEPEPGNARLLRANVALNGLHDRIDILEVALSNQDGLLDLELSEFNFGDHRISVPSTMSAFGENSRRKVQVEARRFDALLPDLAMDRCIAWMDIQGFEGLALEGATRITQNHVPLVVEFWPYGMQRAGTYEKLKQGVSDYSQFFHLGQLDPVAPAPPRPIATLDAFLQALDSGNKDVDANLLFL